MCLAVRRWVALSGRHFRLTAVQVSSLGGPLSGSSRPGSPPRLPAARPEVFVGRVDELATLEAAVRHESAEGRGRPVEITGPPGSGVTTLALELAHRTKDLYPDGQLLVDLGQAGRYAADVLPELLGRLRAPVSEDRRQARYRAALDGRRVLFVFLDASDEGTLSGLLPEVPGCGVIITARSELTGLDVRERCRLAPLDLDATLELLQRVMGADRLYADPQGARAIGRWCSGHPRTARSVAAWAHQSGNRDRSLSSLHTELQRRQLRHVLGADRELPTILGAGWRGLPADARRLLQATALLPSDTFETGLAASVAELPEEAARASVTMLCRAGWLDLAPGEDGRFRMPPPVLRYTRNLPRADVRRRAVVEAALGYYHDRARLADDADRAEVDAMLAWIRDEHPRIVMTIISGVRERLHDRAWQLSVGCGRLFRALGLHTAWERISVWGGRAAERVGADQRDRAVALTSESLGDVHLQLGRVDEAVECYERSRNRRLLVEDDTGLAQVLAKLGDAYDRSERPREAMTSYRRSLELSGHHGRETAAIAMLRRLTELTDVVEGPRAAAGHAKQGRRLCKQAGDRHGALWFLIRLGTLQQQAGELDRALECLRVAESAAERLGDHALEGSAAWERGKALQEVQRPDAAAAAFHRAARALSDAGELSRAVAAFRLSSELYRGLGLHRQAAVDLAAGEDLARLGDRPSRLDVLHELGEACWTIGDLDGAARAFSEGRDLARNQDDQLALAHALDGLARAREQQATAAALDPAARQRACEEAAAAASEAAHWFGRKGQELDRARALHRCGRVRLQLDRPEAATEALEGSNAAYRAGGPPLERAQVLADLAVAHRRQGGHDAQAADALLEQGEILAEHAPDSATEPLNQAAELFEGLHAPTKQAEAHGTRAEAHRRLRAYADAALAHEAQARALEDAKEQLGQAQALLAAGSCWTESAQRQQAASAYQAAGRAFLRADRAEQAIASLEVVAGMSDLPEAQARARYELGAAYQHAGRLEEAVTALDQALSSSAGLATTQRIDARSRLGEVSLQVGNLATAEQAFSENATAFALRKDWIGEARAREALGDVVRRQSRAAEAGAEFERAGQLYARASLPLHAVDAYQQASSVFLRGEEQSLAFGTLEKADDCADKIKPTEIPRRVFGELGRLWLEFDGGPHLAERAVRRLEQYRLSVRAEAPGDLDALREAYSLARTANLRAGRSAAASDLQRWLDASELTRGEHDSLLLPFVIDRLADGLAAQPRGAAPRG